MKIVGIDYSVTCPSVCVMIDDESPRWFVNYKLKGNPYVPLPGVIWTPSQTTPEIARFVELADWVVRLVKTFRPDAIFLEDYAFAASGRITQLSENVGVLKGKLFEECPEVKVNIVAPTTLKKFATGSGRADKAEMVASFIKEFPAAEDWHSLCHPKAINVGSPVADIADSYFLARYGKTNHTNS